jgi:hypothetical protein
MNVQIIKETPATRPVPDALTSSVLDHATVVDISDDDGFGLRNNEGLWPSYNCIDTLVPTPMCPDPSAQKSFEIAPWIPAFEFTLYGGVKCKAVGLDVEDMRTELNRVFERNEGRGMEEALLLNRFVATDSGVAIEWDAPVDLTVTPVSLAAALALLEGYARRHYAGVPTIHMPAAVASLLNERLVWVDGKAFTRLGSKVALGGGYDPEDASAGIWDLYATGEVYIERSSTDKISTYVLPGDGNDPGSEGTGNADNEVLALTERMYRVAVDCFVAKATGSIAASGGEGFGN